MCFRDIIKLSTKLVFSYKSSFEFSPKMDTREHVFLQISQSLCRPFEPAQPTTQPQCVVDSFQMSSNRSLSEKNHKNRVVGNASYYLLAYINGARTRAIFCEWKLKRKRVWKLLNEQEKNFIQNLLDRRLNKISSINCTLQSAPKKDRPFILRFSTINLRWRCWVGRKRSDKVVLQNVYT